MALSEIDGNYIRKILRLHLDPDYGSKYWIDFYKENGRRMISDIDSFNAFKEVYSLTKEGRLEFEDATRTLPVENFIPKNILFSEKFIWVSQTGGTTGLPKHGSWGATYWKETLAFSDQMLKLHKINGKCNWLFIGPTGPHTTGRWVISLAEYLGGKCFTIDLDPRIVKIFQNEKMYNASNRYIKHIWDQVRSITKSQHVEVIFATSRLLEMISENISDDVLKNINAVLHAGTTISQDLNYLLRKDIFPNKPIVGVYGTSTTAVSFQKPYEEEDNNRIIFIPSSPSMLIDVVDDAGNTVSYNDSGHLNTYRFTNDSFIPGFWERDCATRIQPYGKYEKLFRWDWIEQPHSPVFLTGDVNEGVY